jgi:hypothetical protein
MWLAFYFFWTVLIWIRTILILEINYGELSRSQDNTKTKVDPAFLNPIASS